MAYAVAESINELGAQVSVLTSLTVLKAFTNLGSSYDTLLFVVVNLDVTNPCTLLVETSEDGVHPDANIVYTFSCPAGKQASLELGPGLIRRFWRVSSTATGATVQVQWSVRGIHRTTRS